MKKAEMESHAAVYKAHMAVADAAEGEGLYRVVIKKAIEAWPYIDGMMQYSGKYENREWSSILAIDAVLKYAPLLLDFRSLSALEQFLENCKRVERNSSLNITDKLIAAQSRLANNHRLWTHIDRFAEVRQDELCAVLGGDSSHWKEVTGIWTKMGLIQRTPRNGSFLLSLATRMGQVVSAKCPSCGKSAEAPKAMFFSEMACPACKANVLFVLLASQKNPNASE